MGTGPAAEGIGNRVRRVNLAATIKPRHAIPGVSGRFLTLEGKAMKSIKERKATKLIDKLLDTTTIEDLKCLSVQQSLVACTLMGCMSIGIGTDEAKRLLAARMEKRGIKCQL